MWFLNILYCLQILWKPFALVTGSVGKGENMDIDSLTKGIGLISTTITTLKKLKELIPSVDKKQDVEQTLEEAEKNIKIAESEIAKGFNYQLCHRHFPPGIMLEIAQFKSKCDTCGNIEDYDS